MSIRKEFQTFLLRGNLFDLAVGVIIGAAFGAVVTGFVEDLVMPLMGPLLSRAGGTWRESVYEPVKGMKFGYGHFLGVLIDFLIKAFVIFIVLVKVAALLKKKNEAPAAAPTTKPCPECLEPVAIAAKRCKYCTSVLAAIALIVVPTLFISGTAAAQDAPKFDYAKAEEAPRPEIERKAQVRGGVLFLGGNSRAKSGTLGATGAYRSGENRFSAEANAAYVKTSVRTVSDANNNGTIDDGSELTRTSQVSSKLYQAKARYDRFFTLNNAGYASAQVLSDEPAGKKIVGGGQVGYSRQLFKDDDHRVVAELGYDLAFEKSTAAEAKGVSIHSARVFVADESKLSADTGVIVGVEALTNLNKEKSPATGYDGAKAFKDTRIIAKAGLTTTLASNISFAFTVSDRFDSDPSPLKAPSLSFARGFFPRADKNDFQVEAALIVTLF